MKLPSPDSWDAPKYWMYETGGLLVPAVERYLRDEPAQPMDEALIVAYLRQWIGSPVWSHNPHMDAESGRKLFELRARVGTLRTRQDIGQWLHDALDIGIDPL